VVLAMYAEEAASSHLSRKRPGRRRWIEAGQEAVDSRVGGGG